MKNILLVCLLLLASCSTLPVNVTPVSDFELGRYVGKWYEVARLDHRFERGLSNVTATYTIKDDGTVRVTNRGYLAKNKEWEEAVGKAKFSGDPSVGHLKVSFFGPFFGNYVVFELDKVNYQYAFVSGSENSLWFLSRSPNVSKELKAKFISSAKSLGYRLDGLIFVEHKDQAASAE